MRFRIIFIGVLAGIVLGGAISLLRLQHSATPPAPLPEDCGKITSVVLQYHPALVETVIPIYRQFLAARGHNYQVIWVVADAAQLQDIKRQLGKDFPQNYKVVTTGKVISSWSKDRFVACVGIGSNQPAQLYAPARRVRDNPLRINDQEVPYRLARSLSKSFHVRGSDADFDGGDFLATSRHLLASPVIIAKNTPGKGRRFHSNEELKKYLAATMSGKLCWLGNKATDVPAHHVGMYLTVIGDVAAVGDISPHWMTSEQATEVNTAMAKAGGAASSKGQEQLARQLENIAQRMQQLGYRVVRVPLFPSATPRAWISYNNGIVETSKSERIFYMPTFAMPAIDARAAAIFTRELHCRVIPIDCSKIWPLGGSLHCLVNVVGRNL